MKNHNTNNLYALTDEKTGERVDGKVILQLPKRYLPRCFSSFIKDRNRLRGLPGYTREVLDEMCAQMQKGNRLFISECEIAQRMRMNQSTVHRAIKKLKDRDIIKGTKGVYIINPLFALNGGSAYYIQAHTDYYNMPGGK